MRSLNKVVLLLILLILTGCTQTVHRVKGYEEADLISAAQLNVQLAVGYLQRDQLKDANEKLTKAIEQDPENVDALMMKALLLSRLGDLDDAENYYLEALGIKENDPNLRNAYGTHLCKVGRLDEAFVEFKEAYDNQFYETPFLAYANAGACYLQVPDYKKAEVLLRKALRKEPNLAGALISMAELGLKTENYMMTRAYIQRYHAATQYTAESLWMQIQAERKLGAEDHYLKLAKQLLKYFPDSYESRQLQEMAKRERVH